MINGPAEWGIKRLYLKLTKAFGGRSGRWFLAGRVSRFKDITNRMRFRGGRFLGAHSSVRSLITAERQGKIWTPTAAIRKRLSSLFSTYGEWVLWKSMQSDEIWHQQWASKHDLEASMRETKILHTEIQKEITWERPSDRELGRSLDRELEKPSDENA